MLAVNWLYSLGLEKFDRMVTLKWYIVSSTQTVRLAIDPSEQNTCLQLGGALVYSHHGPCFRKYGFIFIGFLFL